MYKNLYKEWNKEDYLKMRNNKKWIQVGRI